MRSSIRPTGVISVGVMDYKFLTTSWVWGRLFRRSQPAPSSARDKLRSCPAVNILQPSKQLFGGLRPSFPLVMRLSLLLIYDSVSMSSFITHPAGEDGEDNWALQFCEKHFGVQDDGLTKLFLSPVVFISQLCKGVMATKAAVMPLLQRRNQCITWI